jgi:hypothetical protein
LGEVDTEANSARGIPWIDSLSRAAIGRYLHICIPPDMCFGKGFLNYVSDCPNGGAVALDNIRVDGPRILDALQSGVLTRIMERDQSAANRLLVHHAFGPWSILFQRTMIDKYAHQRNYRLKGPGISFSSHASVVLAVRPSEGDVREIIDHAQWIDGHFADRYGQAYDHSLLWFYAEKGSVKIPSSSDEALVLEPCPRTGYKNVAKIMTHYSHPGIERLQSVQRLFDADLPASETSDFGLLSFMPHLSAEMFYSRYVR